MIDLFGSVTWEDPSILPNTMRLFAKKVPMNASLKNYTKIVISVGVITVFIEHRIQPITILGGAVLRRVDSVCRLIHNHHSMDRRIDICILTGL